LDKQPEPRRPVAPHPLRRLRPGRPVNRSEPVGRGVQPVRRGPVVGYHDELRRLHFRRRRR
jgi:hypothetical protein